MDRDKNAYSDLTYLGRKTIHVNLPFTRSRESKDVESLTIYLYNDYVLIGIKCL